MPESTTFANTTTRDEHHVSHGLEVGSTTSEDYEEKARSLLNASLVDSPDIEEGIRPNGQILRYNKISNEFAAMYPTGTIKTYFKPMRRCDAPPGYPTRNTHGAASNYDYFLRECRRP